ncbi:hypothetical protein M0Q50_02810 [bacterium]|jgi:hypothetical protein|nr:hypothetical protein [bacterium]
MTEATEEKMGKEALKNRFFELETRKAERAQVWGFIKGLVLLAIMVYVELWFFSSWGWLPGLIKYPVIAFTFFLVQFFIWAPLDVGWGSLPREGFVKVKIIGNKFNGIIGGITGKVFSEDWNVVEPDYPDIRENDFVILGMHVIWGWPFTKIYWQKTEWERWYPAIKKAVIKRELLKEFTVLPYPYYISVSDAEDQNRLKVTLETNVEAEMVNPKKALMRQATTWIDLVKPRIQGGYINFIRGSTFQSLLLNKDDLGKLLMQMPFPDPKYETFVAMIEDVYGIRIKSISVLDISGSDEDEQRAIKAKAIAQLQKEADLITANAFAQTSVIRGMDTIMDGVVHAAADRKATEAEQLIEDMRVENEIKALIRDNPAEFERKYGEIFRHCLDLLKRRMSIDDGSFAEVRTPDSKGITGDLMSLALAPWLLHTEAEKKQKTRNKKEDSVPVETNDEE